MMQVRKAKQHKWDRAIKHIGTGMIFAGLAFGTGISIRQLEQPKTSPARYGDYLRPSGLIAVFEEKEKLKKEIDKNILFMSEEGYGIQKLRQMYWGEMHKLMDAMQNGNEYEIRIRQEMRDMIERAIRTVEENWKQNNKR